MLAGDSSLGDDIMEIIDIMMVSTWTPIHCHDWNPGQSSVSPPLPQPGRRQSGAKADEEEPPTPCVCPLLARNKCKNRGQCRVDALTFWGRTVCTGDQRSNAFSYPCGSSPGLCRMEMHTLPSAYTAGQPRHPDQGPGLQCQRWAASRRLFTTAGTGRTHTVGVPHL